MNDMYRGMTYEQCSREGERLMANAIRHGFWRDLPEKLAALRDQMEFTRKRTIIRAEELNGKVTEHTIPGHWGS